VDGATADAPEERVVTISADTVEAAMYAKKLVKQVVSNADSDFAGVIHSFTVEIPLSVRGRLIGKDASNIRSVRKLTDTRIYLGDVNAEAPDECVVTVNGATQRVVDFSESLIKLVVKALDHQRPRDSDASMADESGSVPPPLLPPPPRPRPSTLIPGVDGNIADMRS
jgi:hypothetical protein